LAPTTAKLESGESKERYNARVTGHAISFHPWALAVVVVGAVVVIFVLLARRLM